ncbi:MULTISPECIES: 50S ribosomal protein L3 [Kosmotoga]|uniref:Large ribosomal subunit protein uL3 n=1 Tax=Kosmotoga olearia (strain ATCC BAA-1733 / DSM 21960 / TBF 19.5.1) TaxID=521045 RepID=RL3_KOSOT|nr:MULTISPECIES: 50S ribosomal protein L3 [Kosmotoga]C5CGR4.1 RecName: Full=Large ribosomal subunit protein uL3; AltName: Full=50S ribosomal protein L3 [Kosmotoga olearia TBF 19.5.1]ACR80583.1 ribosomal protein L3 [Kosmotoga olearia TBF 19.5.1]MDI3523286.1 large subunit ribosomal protein [Kosmotoga sp.]MDK2952784.1 large subunit ribosomal protein [Kosmotoga sp.]OAA19450.1 50S ribosomal protein L3 [Kosmotoga sp. DU53]
MKGIIGRKLGMTTIYEDGKALGVTVIKAGPCTVVQKKTAAGGEYNAIQLGFEELSPERAKKLLTKPILKKFEAAKVKPHRILKEIRVENPDEYNVGDVIDAGIFKEGELVDVTGWTKGRGFTGAMKRWNFGGGEVTHGSKFHRELGSVGNHTEPAKIWKGKKMPGRYGNERVTVLNVKVVKVDAENGLIAIHGAVPGARGGLVIIRAAKRPRK